MATLAILTLLYLLPTLVASQRGHAVGGILFLNFFLGWTGIGWFALMLWALLSPPPFYLMVHPLYYRPYSEWRRY